MSIKFIKEELARFLASKDPEVIAIEGAWGIGKTYSWNKILNENIKSRSIALNNYSYVSLFGLNSLADCQKAIFQNMIDTKEIDDLRAPEDYIKNIWNNLKSFSRKSSGGISSLLKNFEKTKSLPIAIEMFSFLTVRNCIICIDDLERRGSNIDIKVILGLMTQLKEQRNCKIVLILNNEELRNEKSIYDELKEKVIDVEIQFIPTPEESINIVFDTNEDNKKILEYAASLKITNIRILMKIRRLSGILRDKLKEFDKLILERATHTLVLACYCNYSKTLGMPDLDWLKSYPISKYKNKDIKESPENENLEKWKSLLYSYGYSSTSDFDLVILNGVSKGYFIHDNLINEAGELQKEIRLRKDNSYNLAWKKFHNDLSDNEPEFSKELYEAFIENCGTLPVYQLNETVVTLRRLNHNDWADDLIQQYINAHNGKSEFFNITDSRFNLMDPTLVKEFTAVYQQFIKPLILKDVFSNYFQPSSLTKEERVFLMTTSTESYYDYFKEIQDPELKRAIEIISALRIENAQNSLQKIAGESTFNELRLECYGIKPIK